jgi:hypothetical protein
MSLAEGNPDEQKIGAFGVGPSTSTIVGSIFMMFPGFYSLFSVTEEPFVKSGGAVEFCCDDTGTNAH